jgi:8-oxo-dGTP diphosphatase
MARTPVLAAGGIVLRQARSPLIAVVRLRKRNEWVLPKGKLDDGETPRDAAEREVNEETGHDVIVHEFLGTLVYESGGRSKVVHYWRMQADGDQDYELMTDIREVDWLPLDAAVERLSRSYERTFLENVGPIALDAAIADLSRRKAKAAPAIDATPATKSAPAKKRRARPAVPVQLPSAVPVPAHLAEPMRAPVEGLSIAPEVATAPPAAMADEAPAAGGEETAQALAAGEAMAAEEPVVSEAVMSEAVVDELTADPPEAGGVDSAEEAPAVDQPDCMSTVAGPSPASGALLEQAAVTTAPGNGRRKSLAEMLRNWLGSAA